MRSTTFPRRCWNAPTTRDLFSSPGRKMRQHTPHIKHIHANKMCARVRFSSGKDANTNNKYIYLFIAFAMCYTFSILIYSGENDKWCIRVNGRARVRHTWPNTDGATAALVGICVGQERQCFLRTWIWKRTFKLCSSSREKTNVFSVLNQFQLIILYNQTQTVVVYIVALFMRDQFASAPLRKQT